MLKRLLAITVLAGALSGAGVAAASVSGRVHPSHAAAPSGGDVATQTISVSVRGGSLSVGQTQVVIPLANGHGHADVDVVDARGTLSGWTLKAAVDAPSGVHVHLRPSTPVPVTGEADGLSAAKPQNVRSGEVVTLGSAAPGGGGGTYRVGVDVVANGDADSVALMPQLVGG